MAKFNNRQLNSLLKDAFSAAAPDKADQIVKAASKDNRAPIYSIAQVNFKQRYIKTTALIAAVLVAVFGIVFVIILTRGNTPYATVTVESDQCVEITLNRDNRPVSISGSGSAAIRLARQAGKCNTVAEAVDGVLDAMLDNGNLGDNGNTVLITVDSPGDEEALLEDCFDAALDSFNDSGFDSAILTAVASDDKAINRIASGHRISVGKAEMVSDIIRADRSFSTDNLCRLSVNDLNLLSSYRRILYTNIDVYGVSSGCIAPRTALMSALEDLGLSDADATVSLDADRYGLIYSVTVRSADGWYIYRLNAASGEILAVSRGETPQIAQMADNNTPSPAPTEKKTEPATSKATEKPKTPQGNLTVTTSTPQSPSPTTPAANNNTPAPTEAKKPAATTAKPKPTSVPATQKPTQAPTSAPAPTDPPRRDPAVFTASSYLPYNAGLQSGSPLSSFARQISLTRVVNGYNTYYDSESFPYTAIGTQGGITALVCNTDQFRRLTGTADSRFDDDYFATHALYVHMNRDVDYHWIKSIKSAYMDGGALCLYNSDPVGYYITDSKNAERIYTVIYELNKSDLADFERIVEFTE